MNFDDAEDDVLATLAAFNTVIADCPPTDAWRSVRRAGENLIYALVVRCQDSGCTRKEIADTLGVEVDAVHRLIADHRRRTTWVEDEHGNVTKIDD